MDRPARPNFHFVNLEHPEDLKDEATRLRIRRLAMTEVAKARRKPKTKRERNEIVLKVRELTDNQLRVDPVGSGNIDPFCSYPIELDASARGLIANIFSPTTNHSSQLRESWYTVGLGSVAAFHSVLSNSRLFLFQKLHGFLPSQGDDSVALTYHHKAIQSTREMMKDPSKHRSDEILGSITGFMCHHAILGDFSGEDWYKHRTALLRIVESRGGFDTIDRDNLRITLTWVDLEGCFAQDIPPLVPLPQQWQASAKSPPRSPRLLPPLSLAWKQRLPMQLDWISIFDDVVQLISLEQAFNDEQLILASTSGSWMEPTMYRLLAIRPLLHAANPEQAMEEVCRLGTLLFLSPLWRLLGQSPVWTAAISRNLLLVLTEKKADWGELRPLLSWVLYFAAIETKDLAERSMYVSMLAAVMMGMGLQEWNEMLEIIKGVLWIETVFGGSDELIRDEVCAFSVSLIALAGSVYPKLYGIVFEQSMGNMSMQPPAAFLDEFLAALEEH